MNVRHSINLLFRLHLDVVIYFNSFGLKKQWFRAKIVLDASKLP
jgi:hypothetical protein